MTVFLVLVGVVLFNQSINYIVKAGTQRRMSTL